MIKPRSMSCILIRHKILISLFVPFLVAPVFVKRYYTQNSILDSNYVKVSCAQSRDLFAVVMTTYPRQNNRTHKDIRIALKSLIEQRYTNWELYITGDHYKPDHEFLSFLDQIPREKLFFHNLPKPGERLNLTGIELWQSGGVTAMNNAIERIENRYNTTKNHRRIYVANLDDDDVWSPDHLCELAAVFEHFPSVVFAWTKGYFCGVNGKPYPQKEVQQNRVNNWDEQFGGNILHSSWAWDLSFFKGFRYRGQWDFPPSFKGPKTSDYDLFENIRIRLFETKSDYFHRNKPTIEHLIEKGTRCEKDGNLWYPD